MSNLRRQLEARLCAIDGVAVAESMFGPRDAYWVNGMEIAHFEGDAVIEVRLTKAMIRDLTGSCISSSREAPGAPQPDLLDIGSVLLSTVQLFACTGSITGGRPTSFVVHFDPVDVLPVALVEHNDFVGGKDAATSLYAGTFHIAP